MNVRRGGLGRGLGALIPTGPLEDDDAGMGVRFAEVPVDRIDPNPKQPREVFDEDALSELVTSIREVGVLQPVVVRDANEGRYQLIMGERRLRACKLAGLEEVPAIIRDTPDDALLRDALLENLHREQLNPLEEGAAYQQLLQEFGATHEELADRIGRSRSHVSNTLRLLQLSPAVQRRVAAGVISAGHARALLVLTDPAEQDALAGRIVAEGLSVRAVEEIVSAPSSASSLTPRQRRAEPTSPATEALARELGDRLETRVRIEFGRRRGKITVEFATLDDLQRIVSAIAPDLVAHAITGRANTEDGPDDAPFDEATHDEATHDEATHDEATHDEAAHDQQPSDEADRSDDPEPSSGVTLADDPDDLPRDDDAVPTDTGPTDTGPTDTGPTDTGPTEQWGQG